MKLEQIKIKKLLDTSHTIAERLFEGHECPWEALGDINGFIESLGASLPRNEYKKVGKNIWIHKAAQMVPVTTMDGPTVIGLKVQICNEALLGEGAILGQRIVIGSPCEIKNSVIFGEVQVPHFSYVGDSILGYEVHMGAGAVTSDVKADKGLVRVHAEDGGMGIGRRKFGTILGDHAEIGCNNVPNPGTVIRRNSNVYPLSSVRGCVPSDSIYKGQDNIVVREAREVETEQEASEAPGKGKGGLKVVE